MPLASTGGLSAANANFFGQAAQKCYAFLAGCRGWCRHYFYKIGADTSIPDRACLYMVPSTTNLINMAFLRSAEGKTVKWLKTLFKKAEIEEYNLPLEKLFEWFVENSAEQSEQEKQRLGAKLSQLRTLCATTRNKLTLLAEAQLMNAALPEKERQIMLGNREAYIRSLTNFLDQLTIPDESSHDRITGFCMAYIEQMQQLAKSSVRNYVLLKEFFAHEVADIAEQLRAMEQVVAELRNTTLTTIVAIKKKINELEAAMQHHDGFSENIKKEKRAIIVLESMSGAAEQHMQMLKNSKPYQELEMLQKQMAALKGKIKNHQDNLAKAFSVLARPLKKYSHQYPEEARLFEAYLANPGEALLTDTNLLIVEGLNRLRSTILTGQLGLDDKEKQDALARTNELSVEHLKNTAALMHKINEQILDVYKRIRLNSVQREIEEVEYKIAHLKSKQAISIAKLKKGEKKETKKEDLGALRDVLEEDINAFLETHINILLPDKHENTENAEENDEEGDEEEE